MLIPVSVGGTEFLLPPPEFPPWWKFDIFDDTRELLSIATERLGWSSGAKEKIDKELRMRRANDNPQPKYENISQRLGVKERRLLPQTNSLDCN